MVANSESAFSYEQNLIPIFTCENYDFWRIQMKTLFIAQDLWEIIEGGYDETESPEELQSWTPTTKIEYKPNIQKDTLTLPFIQQGLSISIFLRISNATKSKVAWKTLKLQFGAMKM